MTGFFSERHSLEMDIGSVSGFYFRQKIFVLDNAFHVVEKC